MKEHERTGWRGEKKEGENIERKVDKRERSGIER